MKKLNLNEIQQKEVEILKGIDEFCRKNNIKYTLFGGTLIGAVRHKGFIPWDDDIDIAMTRKNYNKFVETYESDNFLLMNYKNNNQYPFQFAKVIDKNTTLKEEDNKKIKGMGIFVDIFPLDKISKKNINLKLKRQISIAKMVYALQYDDKYYSIKPLYKRIIRNLLKFRPSSFYIRKLEKICTKENDKNCEYMGNLVGGQGKQDIWPVEYFYDYINLNFENNQFMAIKEYDKLLKHRFENYMILPPKEERISHHKIIAYEKAEK